MLTEFQPLAYSAQPSLSWVSEFERRRLEKQQQFFEARERNS